MPEPIPSQLPCATCPWRIDKGAETIPNYRHDLACGLLNTVGPGDDFRPVMACHHSTAEDKHICLGYLAREGLSNINVRILLCQRQIPNPYAVLAACNDAGVRLHGNYRAVLRKLSRTAVLASIERKEQWKR